MGLLVDFFDFAYRNGSAMRFSVCEDIFCKRIEMLLPPTATTCVLLRFTRIKRHIFERTAFGREITLGSLSAIVEASMGLYEHARVSHQKSRSSELSVLSELSTFSTLSGFGKFR